MLKIVAACAAIMLLSYPAHGAEVRSKNGIRIQVAPSAQKSLQCVVDYVQRRIRIVSMRGYGPGTVSASLHPSGRAIDINQTGRGVFGRNPRISKAIANAAADHCGVVSGARWHNNDVGHWNVSVSAGRHR